MPSPVTGVGGDSTTDGEEPTMSIWSTEAPVPIVFIHGWATSTEMTWVEPGWFELVKEGGRRQLG